ncbi:eclosion hormone [Bombyx mandarina]|uniref:Eclosion hormone n=1 Tax=Bombyx mandarina TaxID=7092 RepID=A0A6J2K4E4_BOMMA|nr:eclosion hormone [Bombyx mandarina]
MANKLTAVIVVALAVAFVVNLDYANCSPAIATSYDAMEICIENCAQCKKMFGPWFEGSLCAESCIKARGKDIPECESFASISPFLNKL